MSHVPHQVTDTNGARYRLVRLLGRGGQGAVFEVEGGRRAVKLLDNASPKNRNRLRNQLASVRRLDLTDLEIARPLEMLREPDLGYVMEMLTGMEPLQRLMSVPKGTTSVRTWYQQGGGLRRRLRLTGRAADVFAALHGKGLTYADASPQNIFVSSGPEDAEVRLIDSDNIHFDSTAAALAIHTPTFGAPEIVTGASSANSLTDAHAFSVIVFQVLSLAHPLIGDHVANGSPELEEEAMAGRLPWIDDRTDSTNRSSVGIPRSHVLSQRLAHLADRAFGVGLRDPLLRPGISEWAERLHAAGDATLLCRSCRATFYMTAETCPWCGAPRPAFVTADFHVFDPTLPTVDHLLPSPPGSRSGAKLFARVSLTDGEAATITERLARGRTGLASTRPVVEARWDSNRIRLRSLDGHEYRLESPGGSRSARVNERGCDLSVDAGLKPWTLHLGEPDSRHRTVRFGLHRAMTT